jgi:basic membrane lipoprotein Med (substrate-binding protein (PBP1-ABC) superfamily)
MRPWRLAVAVGALALAVACTPDAEQVQPPLPTPEPPAATSPAAGIRVGFVLPPAASDEDDQRSQLAGDLRLVGALRDEGISELRTLEADGPEFVADLATLLAERRTDLICVLGPDAQRVAGPLAVRHPQLRFCAVPAGASEPPANLAAVEVRFEELGHLVGVAAATVAGAIAGDGEDGGGGGDGPIASVLGSDRAGVTRMRDGIRAGVAGRQLLESAPSDEAEVEQAVDAAIEAGATVLILDLGLGAVDAIERAAAAGLAVIAPAAVVDQVEGDVPVLLTWRLRWDVALRPVVASMLDPDVEVPTSVGLSENVFVVTLGDALQGAARALVEDAAAELRRGVRDAQEAPPPTEPVDDGPADGAAWRHGGRG